MEASPSVPKPRPNHAIYLRALRRMSPEQRLLKAFELSAFSRSLFEAGLARRFPRASREDLRRRVVARVDQCRNRSF